jgi:outer membrane protein assembly factor BamB
MKIPPSSLVLVSLLVGGSAPGDWLQFRGSEVSGVVAEGELSPGGLGDEVGGAMTWSAPLPGRGLSSPIVVGGLVVVTCSSGPQQERLHVIAFHEESGKRAWERQFWATGRSMTHGKTCVAAPTPCSDGERIYALFSSNDLICLDLEGKLKWLRGLTVDYPNASNSLGLASSPVVAGGALVVQIENDSDSFAEGVDLETGGKLWRLEREKKANWSSPVLYRDEGGRELVVLQGSAGLDAVDPRTGSVLWSYGGGAATIPSSAVGAGGVIYAPSHGLTALRPGGEVPESLWRDEQQRPGTASPVVAGGRVYSINNAGVLTAAREEDGERLWRLRLEGPFSGSPVVAGDHLYVLSERGVLQVVDLRAPEGEVVSALGVFDEEQVQSSPAIAGGAVFVRGDGQLVRLDGAR